jgi:hypothetical protein
MEIAVRAKVWALAYHRIDMAKLGRNCAASQDFGDVPKFDYTKPSFQHTFKLPFWQHTVSSYTAAMRH